MLKIEKNKKIKIVMYNSKQKEEVHVVKYICSA